MSTGALCLSGVPPTSSTWATLTTPGSHDLLTAFPPKGPSDTQDENKRNGLYRASRLVCLDELNAYHLPHRRLVDQSVRTAKSLTLVIAPRHSPMMQPLSMGLLPNTSSKYLLFSSWPPTELWSGARSSRSSTSSPAAAYTCATRERWATVWRVERARVGGLGPCSGATRLGASSAPSIRQRCL